MTYASIWEGHDESKAAHLSKSGGVLVQTRTETVVSLLEALARPQKSLDFLRLFKHPGALVCSGAIALGALATNFHDNGQSLWLFLFSCWLLQLSGGIILLHTKIEWFLGKLQEYQRTTYLGHELRIGRISLVKIARLYYAWVWTEQETVVFQVGVKSVKILRRGMRALNLEGPLAIPIADFAIPPVIKITGFIPATTCHPRLNFKARAVFALGTDCESIVRRFHDSPEQVNTAIACELQRYLVATLDKTARDDLECKVEQLSKTVVCLPKLEVEINLDELWFW